MYHSGSLSGALLNVVRVSIHIGDQVERWQYFKQTTKTQTDRDCAKLLLDRFFENSDVTKQTASSSQPNYTSPDVADISFVTTASGERLQLSCRPETLLTSAPTEASSHNNHDQIDVDVSPAKILRLDPSGARSTKPCINPHIVPKLQNIPHLQHDEQTNIKQRQNKADNASHSVQTGSVFIKNSDNIINRKLFSKVTEQVAIKQSAMNAQQKCTNDQTKADTGENFIKSSASHLDDACINDMLTKTLDLGKESCKDICADKKGPLDRDKSDICTHHVEMTAMSDYSTESDKPEELAKYESHKQTTPVFNVDPGTTHRCANEAISCNSDCNSFSTLSFDSKQHQNTNSLSSSVGHLKHTSELVLMDVGYVEVLKAEIKKFIQKLNEKGLNLPKKMLDETLEQAIAYKKNSPDLKSFKTFQNIVLSHFITFLRLLASKRVIVPPRLIVQTILEATKLSCTDKDLKSSSMSSIPERVGIGPHIIEPSNSKSITCKDLKSNGINLQSLSRERTNTPQTKSYMGCKSTNQNIDADSKSTNQNIYVNSNLTNQKLHTLLNSQVATNHTSVESTGDGITCITSSSQNGSKKNSPNNRDLQTSKKRRSTLLCSQADVSETISQPGDHTALQNLILLGGVPASGVLSPKESEIFNTTLANQGIKITTTRGGSSVSLNRSPVTWGNIPPNVKYVSETNFRRMPTTLTTGSCSSRTQHGRAVTGIHMCDTSCMPSEQREILRTEHSHFIYQRSPPVAPCNRNSKRKLSDSLKLTIGKIKRNRPKSCSQNSILGQFAISSSMLPTTTQPRMSSVPAFTAIKTDPCSVGVKTQSDGTVGNARDSMTIKTEADTILSKINSCTVLNASEFAVKLEPDWNSNYGAERTKTNVTAVPSEAIHGSQTFVGPGNNNDSIELPVAAEITKSDMSQFNMLFDDTHWKKFYSISESSVKLKPAAHNNTNTIVLYK